MSATAWGEVQISVWIAGKGYRMINVGIHPLDLILLVVTYQPSF